MLEWGEEEEEEERGCLRGEEEACVAAEMINYSALHGSILEKLPGYGKSRHCLPQNQFTRSNCIQIEQELDF